MQGLHFPLMLEMTALGSTASVVLIAPSQLSALTLKGAMVLSYGTFVSVQEKQFV